MFASGAAGLVWQMVWANALGVALGHEMVAVLSAMAAFFGGLAAGAMWLARRLEHTQYPGRWYACLEAITGGWALLMAVAAPRAFAQLSQWIGADPAAGWHWAMAFGVPFVILLPATFAMGASIPAMERLLRQHDSPPLGTIYASNTAGAMAGLLLAVFLLIPEVGLLRTSVVFAGVNVLCALVAWSVWPRPAARQTHVLAEARVAGCGTLIAQPDATVAGVAARLWLSGLLGIGYEVLALRVLTQVTENTIYTYALLLANFLGGTALGAALLPRSVLASAIAADRIDRAIGLLLVAMLGGALGLWWADALQAHPLHWFGTSVVSALAGEWLAGAAAMILPAMAMGALFTLLCRQAQQVAMPMGQALSLNTLGAALAPFVVGVLLLPQVGARSTLVVLCSGYLAMRTVKSWHQPAGWAALAIVSALVWCAPPLQFVDVPAGGRVLRYAEGVMATVSVVEDAEGVARLHINNRVQEGSSASGVVETRLAQLPLLLHAAPRTALFLGYGTGYTANAAALDTQVAVTAVELLPEVIEAGGLFALKAGAPAASRPVTTVAADARRYVQASTHAYDVIVADLFHPARNGAGSLYTAEHFAAVKARLRTGGLFCQWLALHQMDRETLRSIVAAFLQVYPQAIAVLASNSLDTPVLGLLARPDAPRWDVDAIEDRMANVPPSVAAALQQAHLDDAYAVLGSVVAGPQALHEFSGGAVINTDDRPWVVHRAPWLNYAAHDAPRDRLLALVQSWTPRLDGIVRSPRSAAAARLLAYWQARNAYLAVGMRVTPHPDPGVMLQRLREPLLRIVASSPDFHPAAEPLRALAQAVRSTDPALAAQVDTALARALIYQPLTALP